MQKRRNGLSGKQLHEFRMKYSGFNCPCEAGVERTQTETKECRINPGRVKKKIFFGFFQKKSKKMKKSGNRDMDKPKKDTKQ